MIASLILAAALSADAPHTLTLPEALAQAETHTLDLQIAKSRLEQAQLQTRKVWANYLPTLTVGGAYTHNNTEASITMPVGYWVRNVGTPQGPVFDPSRPAGIDNPPGMQTTDIIVPSDVVTATIQKQNQWGAQARLSQAIIAPSLWPAIQASYIGSDVAELSTENARREILFGVAQMYYGAAGLRQAIEVQRQGLELNKKREADAKVRVELGTTPKMALLRAEMDRSRSEQDLKRAENAYRSQIIALATMLNRPADFDVVIPPEPQMPANTSDFEQQAMQRPDVLAAGRNVDLASAQRRIAWFSYLPNVGLNAQYQWANVTGFTGENTSWLVSVGLNWTLFDGGLREANLSETGYKLHEAELNAQKSRDNAIADVKRAELDVDSAIANREKAKEQAQLAAENVNLVQASYENGVATYLEVTDAATSKLNADINYVAETLNASLAQLRLLKSAGLFAATHYNANEPQQR